MDLETYLAKEVCFREHPKDFDACIIDTFGEACFSEFLRLEDIFVQSIDGKKDFYAFFGNSGLYKFFLQINEFKTKNCVEYISAQLPGSKRVLDVGTGDATKLVWYALNNSDAKFTGVDFSEGFLNSAKEKFGKYAVENCFLTYGNISGLPFQDHSFDLVIADHSLHEFQIRDGGADSSFAVTVPEVMRVLRPGGKLAGALTMPDYSVGSIMNWLEYFIKDSGGGNLTFEEKVENIEYSSLVLFNAVKSE